MNFFKSLIVTVAMAAVLGVGMVKMSQGHPAFFVFGMIAFILAFAKIGCLSH